MKHCANDACPDLLQCGFRGEYQDHVETCPNCSQRLTEGPAPARSKTTEWVDQVCVARFSDSAAAHVARARLDSAGIAAVVQDEHFSGLYANTIGLRLFVPSEQAEEAARILASDDAALVEDVAGALPSIDEESPSAAIEAGPPPGVASPYLTAETLAIFLIAWAYPVVAYSGWQSAESPAPTPRELAMNSLWDLGWVVLLCGLLSRDRAFRWNLPETRAQWFVETAWGVALWFVASRADRLFADLGRSAGLDSSPTPWDRWLTDIDLLLVFRITGPLAALHEELLYRVYFQTRLTMMLRGWSLVSVPTSAWLFAQMHDYAPAETAGVFGWGLVLGIAYQVSRKVPRIAIAHAVSYVFRAAAA